jgi:hypothetical protein
MFRELEDGLQVTASLEAENAKLIHTLWQKKLGRNRLSWVPRQRRLDIWEYLTAKGDDLKAEVVAKRGLSDSDLALASKVREWFGVDPEHGMAAKFGLRADDFLEDYLPKIKRAYLSTPKKFRSDGSMREFLQEAFGGRAPKELDAFFKHLRVSDLIDMSIERDPLVLMRAYSSVGHRQMVMSPLMKKVAEWIEAHPKLNPGVAARFNIYRSMIMGIPQSHTETLIKEVSTKIFEKLGLEGGLSSDLVRTIMGWQYMAAMGFRPYMVIRNSFQPFTTLAPRIGTGYVTNAIRETANDTAGTLFDIYRKRGVIRQYMPIFGGEEFDPSSWIGKVVHKGLKWYKNSDEFTRVIAYRATELRFDEALQKLNKGLFKNMDDFLDYSGMWQLPTDLKAQAVNLMKARNFAGAKDLFATEMVTETMFPYRAGMSPTSFRGVAGKMFGMFGHYPVYYVENIKKALKHASPAQKIAFAGTWIGNMSLIYGAFAAIGVKANSFLFWYPALFSGGPLYHLGHQALLAVSPGYKGRQARAELFGIGTKGGIMKSELAKWATTFEAQSVGRALASAEAGEYYGAFLDLGSFPKGLEWLD